MKVSGPSDVLRFPPVLGRCEKAVQDRIDVRLLDPAAADDELVVSVSVLCKVTDGRRIGRVVTRRDFARVAPREEDRDHEEIRGKGDPPGGLAEPARPREGSGRRCDALPADQLKERQTNGGAKGVGNVLRSISERDRRGERIEKEPDQTEAIPAIAPPGHGDHPEGDRRQLHPEQLPPRRRLERIAVPVDEEKPGKEVTHVLADDHPDGEAGGLYIPDDRGRRGAPEQSIGMLEARDHERDRCGGEAGGQGDRDDDSPSDPP